jgi:hypothetical protein
VLFRYDMDMFDSFLAELLVLSLLVISCARVFFIQNAKIDSATVVPAAAFLFSLCTFVVWGAEIPLVLCLALSLLVMLTNCRALHRFCSHLYVDHYSIVFSIFSIVELVLSLILLVLVVLFRPVHYTTKKFNAVKTRTLLSGSLASGLEQTERLFSKASGILYTYAPAPTVAPAESTERSSKPCIIFVPGKRANVIQYEPYFLFLAQKGYTVCAAEFYSSEMKWFSPAADTKFLRRAAGVLLSLRNQKDYDSFAKKTSDQTAQEYAALAKTVLGIEGTGTPLFVVTDGIDTATTVKIITAVRKNCTGYFSLARIREYKTSGYGFVEQTDVWLGKALGVERDSSFFIPRYAANKTIAAAESSIKPHKRTAAPVTSQQQTAPADQTISAGSTSPDESTVLESNSPVSEIMKLSEQDADEAIKESAPDASATIGTATNSATTSGTTTGHAATTAATNITTAASGSITAAGATDTTTSAQTTASTATATAAQQGTAAASETSSVNSNTASNSSAEGGTQ